MYDRLPEGWYGELWMLIRSDYFLIRVPEGKAIAQMRFFNQASFVSEHEMKKEVLERGLLFSGRRKLAYPTLISIAAR